MFPTLVGINPDHQSFAHRLLHSEGFVHECVHVYVYEFMVPVDESLLFSRNVLVNGMPFFSERPGIPAQVSDWHRISLLITGFGILHHCSGCGYFEAAPMQP